MEAAEREPIDGWPKLWDETAVCPLDDSTRFAPADDDPSHELA